MAFDGERPFVNSYVLAARGTCIMPDKGGHSIAVLTQFFSVMKKKTFILPLYLVLARVLQDYGAAGVIVINFKNEVFPMELGGPIIIMFVWITIYNIPVFSIVLF